MNPNLKTFLENFFKNGLESYSNSTRETINPGGVRLYWEMNWKRRERVYIDDKLFNVIKDFTASLYIITRIRLDNLGKPKTVPNGSGFDRQTIGLMLYSQFNANTVHSEQYTKKILAELPELEDHVYSGRDFEKFIPEAKLLEKVNYRNSFGIDENISLNGCVFLIIPSGGEGSSQLWGYRTRKITDRSQLNARTVTDGSAEASDLSNLQI